MIFGAIMERLRTECLQTGECFIGFHLEDKTGKKCTFCFFFISFAIFIILITLEMD